MNPDIINFHKACLTWHASQMSHAIRPKQGGAWLVHLKKKKQMILLWDMVKSHIPNDHHADFISLMNANWHEGMKKSLKLCKYGSM